MGAVRGLATLLVGGLGACVPLLLLHPLTPGSLQALDPADPADILLPALCGLVGGAWYGSKQRRPGWAGAGCGVAVLSCAMGVALAVACSPLPSLAPREAAGLMSGLVTCALLGAACFSPAVRGVDA